MSVWIGCLSLERMRFRGWLIILIVTIPVVMLSTFFSEFYISNAIKEVHSSIESENQFYENILVIGRLHVDMEAGTYTYTLINCLNCMLFVYIYM